MSSRLYLGIDAGGTFTDFVCVELGQKVTLKIHKTLSTPAAPEQAIMDGIRALGLMPQVEKNELQIVHGSTVATNATLEGNLARTVFISNYGFSDMLQLARQTRPSLYALEFAPIDPPVASELCLETGGRLAADGAEVEPLTDEELQALVSRVVALQPEAVAINLLFSFLDDRFERAIETAIREAELPIFISRSSAVLPVYKEYERGIATWLNAALGPVVSGYLTRLKASLADCPLQIMQSSGETIAAERAALSAVHLLLSGPAGGLTAIQFLGKQIGVERIISFDMGGTSTDVALLDREISNTTEGFIDRFPVGVPMVDMHTIGAGGGSIASIDSGGMLQVGPRSAGASPGPACYGQGGKQATVTDANLVLGRLLPDAALADSLRLDKQRALIAMKELAKQIDLSVEETALGIVAIANEHMAEAIRMISVNRGYDPKEFLLASFGGAGGLHVCAVAEAMQMNQAVVPNYGGVLSALGMLVADRGRQFTRTVSVRTGQTTTVRLQPEFEALASHGREELRQEGLAAKSLVVKNSVDMRYVGQSYTLNVPWQDLAATEQAFQDLHQTRYGYSLKVDTEIVNLRVNVLHQGEQFELPEIVGSNSVAIPCNNLPHSEVYGCEVPATVLARDRIVPGQNISGPAIVTEYSATTYVAPGWTASSDRYGNLQLSRLY